MMSSYIDIDEKINSTFNNCIISLEVMKKKLSIDRKQKKLYNIIYMENKRKESIKNIKSESRTLYLLKPTKVKPCGKIYSRKKRSV